MVKPELKKKQRKMKCPKCGRKMKFEAFYDAEAIEHDSVFYDGQYSFTCPKCKSIVEFFRTRTGIGD